MARLELDDIQGLLARGYGTLPAATYVLLRIERPEAAGTWLADLAGQVTPAEQARPAEAVQVALTASGLRRLGLPETALASFPVELVDGMTASQRRRILGDDGDSAPEQWHWGGPADPVNAVLLLYAGDQTALAALAERQAGPAALAAAGLAEVRRLATAPLGDTEPFGFRDGISQPRIAELGPPGRSGPTQHVVPAGEFVLGYDNAYGQRTESPSVEPADDPDGLLPRTAGSGRGDLGRNGSYLVLRQLGQDVDSFWRRMEEAGGAGPDAAVRLAAKLVGRWPDGTPLATSPDHPAPELAGDNDFGYARADAAGLGCPVGAHIRRANPRDALDPDAGPARSLEFANRHRLLRRGRAYGDPADPGGQGIHFICLNANLARQFEFVQHTWLNNPKFGALYDDTDPLVATHQGGGGRTFTVPARPVRRRVTGLPPFVTVRGGAYFFLPGRRALHYLATLPRDPTNEEDAVTGSARARYALAGIRLLNGGLALFTPEQLARRLGADPDQEGAIIYVLRMFGIRTLLLGADLLLLRGEELDRALRRAPLIHASDTFAAAAAGAKGYLAPRTAAVTTLISGVNTALAVAAKGRRRPVLTTVIGGAAALGAGLAIGSQLRKRVAESAPEPAGGYHSGLGWRLYEQAAEAVNRGIGWDKLPTPLGLAVLAGVRDTLRKHNLYDTSAQPAVNTPPVGPPDPRNLVRRTIDGTYNDLEQPAMGMAGSRFGRNVPIEHTWADPKPMEPSPREISRELLTRQALIPAESVNALVAAWLQWMIRDWFSHGRSPTEDPWQVPLAEDDPWPERPMRIMRTRPDPTRPPGPSDLPPTYANTETPWWDGSQIYGTTPEGQRFVRSGEHGKLRLGPDGLPPFPDDPDSNPALVPGFWLGLAMLRALFTLEHNAICDRLRAEYPAWEDDELFDHARLVNSALIAKIHTTEWTPAVISHPTTTAALRANWWGLAGERIHNLFGRLSDSEIISGIPGSQTQPQHYGVPYSLTEEFVAVYRMHPLIPDDYAVRSAADDQLIQQLPFRDLAGPAALEVMAKVSQPDLLYTFGTMHPGLVTLHNFPRDLQTFQRPDGKFMDLGAVNILRSRELGVPRYNEFRRLLHLEPAADFDALTDDPAWAEEIRRVYRDDIEAVNLSIGMFAEPKPKGFAFSDTAFRIFILMASRRLNSDRFFTRDYTARVYTQPGLDWIDDNTMVTVLQRHHPELGPAMRRVANAFQPWARST